MRRKLLPGQAAGQSSGIEFGDRARPCRGPVAWFAVIKRSFRFGLRLGLISGLGYAVAKIAKLWKSSNTENPPAPWPVPAEPPAWDTQSGPSPAAPQPPPSADQVPPAKPPVKKPSAQEPAPKKAATEAPVKKAAPKKAAPKKAAPKKAAPNKAAGKKAAGKKSPPRKRPAKRPDSA